MKLEQVLKIFGEYSSVFTVVKPNQTLDYGDTIRIFLTENFDRQEIADYVFKIEGDILFTFSLFYNELRGLICGRRMNDILTLRSFGESSGESRLRYMIAQKIQEYHQVKKDARRNIIQEL